MKQTYSSPVLEIVLMRQTDVVTESLYESKDVLNDDIGEWE